MGQKIKKKDILDELKSTIDKCLAYQKADPDKTAKKRVDDMSKNPCSTKRFYVNVTLKSPEISQTDKMSERVKRLKVKHYLLNAVEMNSVFQEGCIIEVPISNTSTTIINVTSCGSYQGMVSTLVQRYLDDSCILLPFKPRKSVTSNNYIEDDENTAIAAGKSKIVYAMARFSLHAIKELVEDKYDKERFDIYSFALNNMQNVAYVDMTRKTSLEQNVHQYFSLRRKWRRTA